MTDHQPRKLALVGLTGGIGAGKSTAAERFARLGVPVIDTDRISHDLTKPGGRAIAPIVTTFGSQVIAEDGSLDRVRMRDQIFSSRKARHRLEAILHPMIADIAIRMIRRIDAAGKTPYAVVVIPLLAETGWLKDRLSRIITVECERERQIQRVMDRSRLSRDAVVAILNAQASPAKRLAIADDVIDNDGNLDALDDRIVELDRLYRQRFTDRPSD